MKVYSTDYKYSIFIFCCLILPRNPQVYVIFCSILTLLFIYPTKFKSNTYSQSIIYLTTFIVFTSVIRFLTSFDFNFRDFLEPLRYLPIVIIFLSMRKWQKIKFENLVDATFIYLLIDGLISYLQFSNTNLFRIKDIVKVVYNSERHYQFALGMAQRTLGLSTGPGDHGSIIFVVFTIMTCGFFLLKTRKLTCVTGILISFMVILSSQSRTAFVAVGFSVLVASVLFFIKKSQANVFIIRGIWGILGLLILMLISQVNELLENYRYLNLLFTRGLEINSYVLRQEKWTSFIDATQEKLYWLPIGWGKDFFGDSSSAMDSEYVYIYCVYGVLVFALLSFLIIRFLFLTIFKLLRSQNLVHYQYNALLFVTMSGGLVIAATSSFLLDPRISYIIALVATAKYWEDKRNLKLKKALVVNNRELESIFKRVSSKK